MSDPKVSVCIPTWQSAHFIGRAIEGALAQRFADFELLISDNASEDGTEAIVRRYMDPRIRYRRHSGNVGYTTNVRSCIEWARGRYAIILCADDYWVGEVLTPAVALLDGNESMVFVYTAYYVLYEDDRVFGKSRYVSRTNRPRISSGREYIFQELLHPKTILSSTLFRRDAALASRSFADGSLRYTPDKDHRLRLALRGEIACIDEPLVFYRVHPASITSLSDSARWFDEEIRIIGSTIALAGLEGEQARKLQKRCNRMMCEAFLNRLAYLKRRHVARSDLVGLIRRVWQTSKRAFASRGGVKGLLLGLVVPSSALEVVFRWRRRLASSGGS
jgi:glycosyltransferase involved in cell wall biosynthesis